MKSNFIFIFLLKNINIIYIIYYIMSSSQNKYIDDILTNLASKINIDGLKGERSPAFIKRDLINNKEYYELIKKIIENEKDIQNNILRKNTIINKCIEMLNEKKYLIISKVNKKNVNSTLEMQLSVNNKANNKVKSNFVNINSQSSLQTEENKLKVKNKINKIYRKVENMYIKSPLQPFKQTQIESLKKNMCEKYNITENEIEKRIKNKFNSLKIPKKPEKPEEKVKNTMINIIRKAKLIKEGKIESLDESIKEQYGKLSLENRSEISKIITNNPNIGTSDLSTLIKEKYMLLLNKQCVDKNNPINLLNLFLVLSKESTMTKNEKKDFILNIGQIKNNSYNTTIDKYLDLLNQLYNKSINTHSTPNFKHLLENAIKFYNNKMTKENHTHKMINSNVNSIITKYDKEKDNILVFCINLLNQYEEILKTYNVQLL